MFLADATSIELSVVHALTPIRDAPPASRGDATWDPHAVCGGGGPVQGSAGERLELRAHGGDGSYT